MSQDTIWKAGYATVQLRFVASGDGEVAAWVDAHGEPVLTVQIAQGALQVIPQAVNAERALHPVEHGWNGDIVLDIEDTYGVANGGEHACVLTCGNFGTRVYLDGYQVFSCATDIRPVVDAHLRAGHSGLIELGDVEVLEGSVTSEEVHRGYSAPAPDIEFAAAYIAERDLEHVSQLNQGTIYARFRVRGLNQFGTIIAAAHQGEEVMNLSIDDDGFLYKVLVDGKWIEYPVRGSWNDGDFHDVVIRAMRGAIDVYVNGSNVLHQPGQYFFGALETIDYLSIGEDTHGVRLCGEVRNGGIYTRALTDGQIATISNVEALTDTALFDKGYAGSASYRIPSLVTTPSGVIIAGSDQRVTISNDSPNEIHFIIRRSLDGGNNWEPLQTVIAYPGDGLDGASVIDSCMFVDRDKNRVIVLIDHFPGGIGFANASQDRGTDDTGRLILEDHDGHKYFLNADGSVESADAPEEAGKYRVDEDGFVTYAGKPGGNIYYKKGIDPRETLLSVRTSYLVEVHSDDDGATWSKPRFIDWMVREEWMRFLGVCPGSGTQLSHPKHAGRLLVPFYCCSDSAAFFAGGALISDDGGETWRRGKCINEGRDINGKVVDITHIDDNDATTHEAVFVEADNGDVVVLFRNQHSSGCVGKAISHDGGETWDTLEFEETIPDIFSQPNAINLPPSQEALESGEWVYGMKSDRVVFANACLMRPYRGYGVLRYSEDGGRTWVKTRCYNPYHYVYQCMSVRPDGDLGLLWERETAGVYYTHVPLEWLGIDK